MIEKIKNEQAGYTRAVDAQSQDRECEARRDCKGVSRIAHQRVCIAFEADIEKPNCQAVEMLIILKCTNTTATAFDAMRC